MKLTKASVGDEVIIYFDDHVENGDSPIPCTVRGKLLIKAGGFVVVEAWSCLDEDESVNKANHKIFTVVTGAVRGYAVTKPEWEGDSPEG